jgi:hypothetical protein
MRIQKNKKRAKVKSFRLFENKNIFIANVPK